MKPELQIKLAFLVGTIMFFIFMWVLVNGFKEMTEVL